jgi:hypothetical protein
MNVDDLNPDELGIYIHWNSILQDINEADCPIDEKIEDLNEMFIGLKKYKSGAGKAFSLIGRKILTTKIELIKRQKKRNEEEEKRKMSTAAFKIQGMYKTKKAKKKRCNLKIRKILDEHLRDKVSNPLKKIEELALKKSPSTKFKIQSEPQGSLLKPDGTFEVPEGERFALSKEQQEFWDQVKKEVSEAPPGFKHVKPSGKPPYDKDGKPIGGRRKKTKRRKRRKRRKTRKRRTKSRRKRRTKRRRTRKR